MNDRQRRVATMRQFELQYPKYPLQILERLTNFRYRMFEEVMQVEMLATVLTSSWDFYEHRLNLGKHDYSLVICQRHNAALPLYTLELDTQHMYDPGAVPDKRSELKRRNPDEMKILISQIIIGASAGMAELKAMPDRTRQRYLVLREQYLQPKVGRPWAS